MALSTHERVREDTPYSSHNTAVRVPAPGMSLLHFKLCYISGSQPVRHEPIGTQTTLLQGQISDIIIESNCRYQIKYNLIVVSNSRYQISDIIIELQSSGWLSKKNVLYTVVI